MSKKFRVSKEEVKNIYLSFCGFADMPDHITLTGEELCEHGNESWDCTACIRKALTPAPPTGEGEKCLHNIFYKDHCPQCCEIDEGACGVNILNRGHSAVRLPPPQQKDRPHEIDKPCWCMRPPQVEELPEIKKLEAKKGRATFTDAIAEDMARAYMKINELIEAVNALRSRE